MFLNGQYLRHENRSRRIIIHGDGRLENFSANDGIVGLDLGRARTTDSLEWKDLVIV